MEKDFITIKGRAKNNGGYKDGDTEVRVLVHVEQEVLEGKTMLIPVNDLSAAALIEFKEEADKLLKYYGGIGDLEVEQDLPTRITRVQTYPNKKCFWAGEWERVDRLPSSFKKYKVLREHLHKDGKLHSSTIHENKYKTVLVRYHSRHEGLKNKK